jgi:hypothetical protein
MEFYFEQNYEQKIVQLLQRLHEYSMILCRRKINLILFSLLFVKYWGFKILRNPNSISVYKFEKRYVARIHIQQQSPPLYAKIHFIYFLGSIVYF